MQQYHVSTSGAVTVSGVTGNRLAAMKNILALDQANIQERAYGDVLENAILTGDLLNNATASTSAANYFNVPFLTTGSLGPQLKMVARLIAARNILGMKRQIFFCSVGGYDTHTSQVGNNAHPGDPLYGGHADLISELSESIYAFQRAIEQLASQPGASALPQSVTAFTASDFGRTFRTNGQGSDHAWGSHHLIVGGAVKGQTTYGTFPVLEVSGPDAVPTSTEGRWIPTIAVDQYSATLAKWFGVADSDIPTVFPNIGRFAKRDLDFMA